jgi:hypothetical protein
MDIISNDDLIKILREAIAREGGPTLYAKRLGVSCAFVSRMAAGGKYVSGRVLTDLGYERVVGFRKVMQPCMPAGPNAIAIQASARPAIPSQGD